METTMTSTDAPRRTRQREVIWAHLSSTAPFQTAQQIYDALRDQGTPVSLPTVYRTLAAMAVSGEVDVLTAEGQSVYRRCSPHHHHHLVCRRCGRAVELTEARIEAWATQVGEQHGFTEITHITEVSGLCPPCHDRRTEETP